MYQKNGYINIVVLPSTKFNPKQVINFQLFVNYTSQDDQYTPSVPKSVNPKLLSTFTSKQKIIVKKSAPKVKHMF